MYKIKINNEINGNNFELICQSSEEVNQLKETYKYAWGKPDRWSGSDENLSERVIETRQVANPIHSELIITEYHLKADYTIQVIDLDHDYDYKLQLCYQNRQAAYGSWESQLDEIFHNGLEAWQARIAQVKLQFPLPVKE